MENVMLFNYCATYLFGDALQPGFMCLFASALLCFSILEKKRN